MRALLIAALIAFVLGYVTCRWQMRQRPELSKTQEQELRIRRSAMYDIQEQCALNYHEPLAVIVNDEIRKASVEIGELR